MICDKNAKSREKGFKYKKLNVFFHNNNKMETWEWMEEAELLNTWIGRALSVKEGGHRLKGEKMKILEIKEGSSLLCTRTTDRFYRGQWSNIWMTHQGLRNAHVAYQRTLNPNCQNTLGSKTEGRKESAKVILLIRAKHDRCSKPTQN